MKHIKLNRYLVMALGMLIAVALFAFGKSAVDHHSGIAMATAGAVVLTAEEKEGFSDQEQKVILAVKKQVTVMKEDLAKGGCSVEYVTGQLKDLKEGLTTKEIKELKDELSKLDDICKAQGLKLKAIEENGGSQDNGMSFVEMWKKHLPDFKEIRAAGTGQKTIFFGNYAPTDESEKKHAITGVTSLFAQKTAGATSVTNNMTSSPTDDTNPYSPFPIHTGEVIAIRRNPNLALNIVDVGSTTNASISWSEEGGGEGDAEVTAEGATKTLQDKDFVTRRSDAVKVAGRVTITEEMEDDAPRIATAVRRLFEENVTRKWDDKIYADIIAAAPGYTLTSLDDQVDNADDYAAIGAAICQIENGNGTADTIVLNPADKWKMRLIKGSDGHYIAPPFTVGNQTYDGIRVIISNKVSAGYFLVGEGKTYKVDIYKPYNVRVGFSTGDFEKNQFSLVGEVRFHSYIATNDLACWVYAAFATVKAAIEKP